MSEPIPIIRSALNPTAKPERDANADGRKRVLAVETREWVTRLTENADFQRFLDFLKEGRDAMEQPASDLSRPAVDRDASSQRYFHLKSIIEWPEQQIAACSELLKFLDENQ